MTFSFPTSEVTLDETTYRVDAAGTRIALALVLVALGFFVAFMVDARKRPGALANPIGLACVGLPIAVATALFTLSGMPYLSFFQNVDPRGASTLFHRIIEIDAGCAAVGVGVLVASLAVLMFRQGGRVQILRFFVPAVLASLYPITQERAAREIVAVGSLPFYIVEGQKQMHVGLERDIHVELARPPGEVRLLGFSLSKESEPQPVDAMVRGAWMPVDHMHVAAHAKGPVSFTAEAKHGPVTLTTRMSVEALVERASPLLSLRVGDKLHYRVRAKSSDGTALYFIRIKGSEDVHEVLVEVIGTHERDGFRTFVISVATDGSRREFEVVAVDGETRLFEPTAGRLGAPIVSFSADGEEAMTDPIPCHFALLDGATAMCQRGGKSADVPAPMPTKGEQSAIDKRGGLEGGNKVARPPIAFAAAGPATFDSSSSANGVGSFTTAFVAVMTIGLVILPDGSSSSSYTLVSTERGPAGAPEALH